MQFRGTSSAAGGAVFLLLLGALGSTAAQHLPAPPPVANPQPAPAWGAFGHEAAWPPPQLPLAPVGQTPGQPVSQTPVAPLPPVGNGWDARIEELENRVAELQAQLNEQQPAAGNRPAEDAENEPDPAEPYRIGTELGMKASWQHGLELETPYKDFRVHIGGRTQFDMVWLDAEPGALIGAGGVGDEDAFNFRRARLRVDGTMYEQIEWAVEYDFVNTVNLNTGLQPASEVLNNVSNVPAPTDLWFWFKELPWIGNLRVGNFKDPIGLEHLASSRFLDFMERSPLQDAYFGPFNNGFSPGVMVFNWTENERATWALGWFKSVYHNNPFGFDTGDGEYALTGRVTALPWYDEPTQGRYLVHVGLSGSHRELSEDRIRIRSRGSLRNGPGVLNPVLVDTGVFFGDAETLVGTELAVVWGPWLWQSEYVASFVDEAFLPGNNLGTVFTHGYYTEVLYFITGEHRAYDRRFANFGRVVPIENFFLVRGLDGICFGRGAWQVGARYSYLDLRDDALDGGVLHDVTLGLNWFLNPNMKLQWNYIFTHRDAAAGEGDIHGLGMRLAHDF